MPMMLKTFCIGTLGCKLNIYESEAVADRLTEAGWTETDDPGIAEVIFINTCTVTSKADAKCRNYIRRMRRAASDAIIIVAGCMVSSDPDAAAAIPEADILLDNKNKSNIIDAITQYKSAHRKTFYNDGCDGRLSYEMHNLSKHSRAFIKVEDGCTNYCSYCRIPYARGQNVSRPLNDILAEISRLRDAGFREYVITGVNTGSYLSDGCDFAEMLDTVSDKFDDCRFRVSSIEPQYVNDDFLRVFAKPNICAHLHIPIQSGSDAILRLMERKYTVAEFESVIDKARAVKPEMFLSTDLIVGFPSEDDTEWQNILDTVNRIHFTYIHVFGFSPRPGTKAYSFGNKVPERIRDYRVSVIQSIANGNTAEYRLANVGKVTQVIAEQDKNGLFVGKTDNYLDVRLDQSETLRQRELYTVRLYMGDDGMLCGQIIN